jgi:hypothetical protein
MRRVAICVKGNGLELAARDDAFPRRAYCLLFVSLGWAGTYRFPLCGLRQASALEEVYGYSPRPAGRIVPKPSHSHWNCYRSVGLQSLNRLVSGRMS